MQITIYISRGGEVTITDLPTDFLSMVSELSDQSSEYFCKDGIAGYALDDIINNIK